MGHANMSPEDIDKIIQAKFPKWLKQNVCASIYPFRVLYPISLRNAL